MDEGTEIAEMGDCLLETTIKQSANSDCTVECKLHKPQCVAYSYDSLTKKCTIAMACDTVWFEMNSNSVTYAISEITTFPSNFLLRICTKCLFLSMTGKEGEGEIIIGKQERIIENISSGLYSPQPLPPNRKYPQDRRNYPKTNPQNFGMFQRCIK